MIDGVNVAIGPQRVHYYESSYIFGWETWLTTVVIVNLVRFGVELLTLLPMSENTSELITNYTGWFLWFLIGRLFAHTESRGFLSGREH